MTEDSVKQRRAIEQQVERWTAEAKKLFEGGQEAAALDLYRRAADELPGAPWLQHRTADIARKLKQPDVAIIYFRRAATAFHIANFPKRAVAPLRTAWSLAIEGLPATSKILVELTLELMQLHRKLGFAADATVTFERTNAALRLRGFSEIAPHTLEALERATSAPRLSAAPLPTRSNPSSQPPSSRPTPPSTRGSTPPPSSSVAPRSSGPTPPDAAQTSRHRALARLLSRR